MTYDSSAVERHERRESVSKHNMIGFATIAMVILLQVTYAAVRFVAIEARVAALDEWRRTEQSLAIEQQRNYIDGLMAIQGLSTTLRALTEQVAVLAEQQAEFRRELSAQRK